MEPVKGTFGATITSTWDNGRIQLRELQRKRANTNSECMSPQDITACPAMRELILNITSRPKGSWSTGRSDCQMSSQVMVRIQSSGGHVTTQPESQPG